MSNYIDSNISNILYSIEKQKYDLFNARKIPKYLFISKLAKDILIKYCFSKSYCILYTNKNSDTDSDFCF